MEESIIKALKSFDEGECPSFVEICQRIGEVNVVRCNIAFVQMYKRGEFYADKEFNRFYPDDKGGEFLKYSENLQFRFPALDHLDSKGRICRADDYPRISYKNLKEILMSKA
jgi:hypothetical protein